MSKFGGTGFEGDGAYVQMIAKIQDIKAAPHHGQKRLVVRERGKQHQHAVIDIDMKAFRELEEKQTYIFQVKEKTDSRYGHQRRGATGFKAYSCDDAPTEFTQAALTEQTFNRFGGCGSGNAGRRTRF